MATIRQQISSDLSMENMKPFKADVSPSVKAHHASGELDETKAAFQEEMKRMSDHS